MYSREQIDQVRSAVDLVEVIRGYVPSLSVQGRTAKGLCPFHAERTPSFHVQPEKGFFKCFGCGEAGDVISFVSKIEQVSFVEALEKLASDVGITLKKEKSFTQKEPEGKKDLLYRLLQQAHQLYQDQLWDDQAGRAARSYLEERKISSETIQFFQLGCAPSSGGGIFETLVKKGFSVELCQEAGLVSRSNTGRFYDPLFGRLIFPIFDHFGHIVGFGGRILPQKKSILSVGQEEDDSEAPKYINSPETPVFSKGKLLYGLFQSKNSILKNRRALVMEGYMDVVGVFQGGVHIALATLGTAFTKDHAKLLKRYADEVFVFFDPDAAGERAALKSFEPLIQESLFPRVVSIGGHLDPDELILEKGQEYFDTLLENAPDFVDYLLDKSMGIEPLSLMKKSQLANQILNLVKQSPDEVLKSQWVAKISSKLGLDKITLSKEVERKNTTSSTQENKENFRPKVAKVEVKSKFIPTAEEEFLQLFFRTGDDGTTHAVSVDDFSNEREKKLFLLMQKHQRETGKVSLPEIHNEMLEAEREWLLNLFLEEKEFTQPMERQEHLVRAMRIKRDKDLLTRLSQSIASGPVSPEIQEQYKALLKRVKGSRI